MSVFEYLMAKAEDPDVLQVSLRGLLVFISGVIIMRLGAKRLFGKGTSTDNVLVIILGGVLSRVITGAAAYLPAICAVVLMLLCYRFMLWLSMNPSFTKIITGAKRVLFENGKPVKRNMECTLASMEDIQEAMRIKLNTEDTEGIDKIYMERNGEISVIKKKS